MNGINLNEKLKQNINSCRIVRQSFLNLTTSRGTLLHNEVVNSIHENGCIACKLFSKVY